MRLTGLVDNSSIRTSRASNNIGTLRHSTDTKRRTDPTELGDVKRDASPRKCPKHHPSARFRAYILEHSDQRWDWIRYHLLRSEITGLPLPTHQCTAGELARAEQDVRNVFLVEQLDKEDPPKTVSDVCKLVQAKPLSLTHRRRLLILFQVDASGLHKEMHTIFLKACPFLTVIFIHRSAYSQSFLLRKNALISFQSITIPPASTPEPIQDTSDQTSSPQERFLQVKNLGLEARTELADGLSYLDTCEYSTPSHYQQYMLSCLPQGLPSTQTTEFRHAKRQRSIASNLKLIAGSSLHWTCSTLTDACAFPTLRPSFCVSSEEVLQCAYHSLNQQWKFSR